MLSFIYNNKGIIVLIALALFAFLLYLFVKSLPTKTEKKENTKKDKKPKVEKVFEPKETEQPKKPAETEVKPEPVEPTKIDQKEEETEQTKDKKTDKKPKIVQVYKRDRSEPEATPEKIDPIYDRNVEFVNTSKNIAKFKSFSDEVKKEEPEKKDEFGFVAENEENCEYCEDHVKHFDHSRRLKKYVNEDDMFGSHISDKYLKMDADRHINTNSNLFARTDAMMDNSEDKMGLNNRNQNINYMRDWISDEYNGNQDMVETDEDRRIDLKTAVIADTYLRRKKKK